jgi:two-component system chemotaxis sensor kinase CheA
MDVSEYLPMFLAEGREHLQELNLVVVRIEGQPATRRRSTRSSASRTR